MLNDYRFFDLSQLFEDMTDYLVLIDGILEEMPKNDPDIEATLKLENHINGILEVVDEIWEKRERQF